jgi:signal transduction protein with GAF and PtsI domain
MSRPKLKAAESTHNLNRLRRVLEATKLLHSTIHLSELTEIILGIVREEVGVARGTVFVVDAQRKEIISLVAQDVKGDPIRLRFGSGIAGTVAETGETLDIADAYADSR